MSGAVDKKCDRCGITITKPRSSTIYCRDCRAADSRWLNWLYLDRKVTQ